MRREDYPPALVAIDKIRSFVGSVVVTAIGVAFVATGNFLGRLIGLVILIPALLVAVDLVRKRRRRLS